jgi:hypothetical protein
MGFLNKKMNWSNAEFIPFKVCIAAAYLLIGSHFADFFTPYKWCILGLFSLTLVWVLILWIRKMKQK